MDTDNSNAASHRLLYFGAFTLCGLLAFTVLFYAVEDWRGRLAWQRFKTESAAKGVKLDWSAFIPPPVPGDENFFRAPDMQTWFVGRGMNSLSSRLSFNNFESFSQDQDNHTVAQIIIVPANARVAPGDADLVLQYDCLELTVATETETVSDNPPTASAQPVIPLIVMDEVPLNDAIKALAHQAGLNYQLDPAVMPRPQGLFRRAAPWPTVSVRWTDLTAMQALNAVLENHNLALRHNPKTGVDRIVKHDRSDQVHASADVRVQLAKLLTDAVNTAPNSAPRKHLTAALGFELADSRLGEIRPARIIVRTDRTPGIQEIKNFFPPNPLGNGPTYPSQVNATSDGNNFKVYLYPPKQVAAADYLAWSDQFKDDFESIRAALQLSYARMDGNYDSTESLPIPNFVTVRVLAQTLGQRAQCYLLLDQPEKALREVTLLHQMSRLMEARPTGKPMTLIAAMINVAVTGLYVGVVADGIRLHVWREPQLVAVQQQLAEINLLPFVHDAFEFEAAVHGHRVESMSSHDLAELQVKYNHPALSEKFKDPTYLFLTFAPRGWIYQSIATGGRLELGMCANFDLTNHLVFPKKTDAWTHKVEAAFHHVSPYNFYASQIVPNFMRAIQTTAKNQTLVNEAQIVCALERYRLGFGRYPESLDALTPKFIERLPADVIGGAPLKYRLESGQFVLYSVGWNEQDDGGAPCWGADLGAKSTGDLAEKDWVWPYQEKPAK